MHPAVAASSCLPVAAGHRHRLLEGMAATIAAKGYAAATVADVVRAAGVSKRTFYEHFGTKDECLIALYAAASRNALAVLRAAIDPAHPWQAQVEQALRAYLGYLARNPALVRPLFMEILALGAPGLQARRRAIQELARFVLDTAGRGRAAGSVDADLAMAVVGGINELILQAVERDRLARLDDLVEPAGRLVRAVLGGTTR